MELLSSFLNYLSGASDNVGRHRAVIRVSPARFSGEGEEEEQNGDHRIEVIRLDDSTDEAGANGFYQGFRTGEAGAGAEEEEEEEEETADWNTEEEFVTYIKQKIGKPNATPQRSDLYFEMFFTIEEGYIKVWWLPIDHPYVKMILHTNRDTESATKYECFDSFRGAVLYEASVIEVAINTVWELIQKNNGDCCSPTTKTLGSPSDKKTE